jgi:hypothetical protein
VSSHRRLIAFLLSPLTLSLVRRFALIAVGATVASILLLPAGAAWLREPAPTPLPDPLKLERSGDSGRPSAWALDDRVYSKLLSRSRSVAGTVRVQQQRRQAAHRARLVVLAPTPMRVAPRWAAEDDDNGFDDPVHALDGRGDDELGDD